MGRGERAGNAEAAEHRPPKALSLWSPFQKEDSSYSTTPELQAAVAEAHKQPWRAWAAQAAPTSRSTPPARPMVSLHRVTGSELYLGLGSAC